MWRQLINGVFCLLIITGCNWNHSSEVPTMTYRISAQSGKIHVQMVWDGKGRDSAVFELPDSWANQKNLYTSIHNLHFSKWGVTLDSSSAPHKLVVRYAEDQPIFIEYDVEQDWEGPLNRSNYYRPIVNADYFHFVGNTALLLPDSANSDIKALLHWDEAINDGALYSSLGVLKPGDKILVEAAGLDEALFTGGDFRVDTIEWKQQKIVTAIQGDWNFSDKDWQAMILKAVALQRSFWNDLDIPYYFISLVPVETKGQGLSYGGTCLHQGFATFLSSNAELTDRNVQHLYYHEMMHEWIGRQLIMADPEESMYWFSEGFTEFFSYRMMQKAGLLDDQSYLDVANEALYNYYLSPVRDMSFHDMPDAFWNDPAARRLPYDKGFAVALLLEYVDLSHSIEGDGLTATMRGLLSEAEKDPTFRVSAASLPERMWLESDVEARTDSVLMNVLYEGGLLEFPDSLKPCVRVEKKMMGAFELGFTFSKDDNTIVSVLPGSQAYDAELRKGQIIKQRSIYYNNIQLPVMLVILADGEEKAVQYFPESKDRVEVPQLYRDTRKECQETISN